MKKFRFLPDVATADLAFEAFGRDRDELFENAGLALEEAMVKTESVEPRESFSVDKEEENLEELLFSFLEELVFLKDSEQLLFNKLKCRVEQENGKWKLSATLSGEKIDPKKHKLGVDVKAVTKHLFEVGEDKEGYWAQVILDI